MTQLRIGDAERDSAVERLGEHFAAGRLTKDEFDERATQATQARYDSDLRPLFADLPGPNTRAAVTMVEGGQRLSFGDARAWIPRGRAGTSPWPSPSPFNLMLLVPLLLLAMAVGSFVLFATPWLLIPLIWIAMASHGTRQHRRRRHNRYPQRHPHWGAHRS